MLAARKATSEDIVHLNAIMDEMRKMVKQGSMGHEEDVRFHMGIAYATKNRVQIHMMKRFYDLLYYGIWKSHMYLYQEKPDLEATLSQHGKILEAIRNHDTQMAYDVMREHIKFVMEFLAVRAE